MQDEFDDIIELIDENGEEARFRLVTVLEYRDDTYLALEVLGEEGEEPDEAEIVFMAVVRDENGEDCYEPVEDEAVNEELFNLFLEKMDEEAEEEEDED